MEAPVRRLAKLGAVLERPWVWAWLAGWSFGSVGLLDEIGPCFVCGWDPAHWWVSQSVWTSHAAGFFVALVLGLQVSALMLPSAVRQMIASCASLGAALFSCFRSLVSTHPSLITAIDCTPTARALHPTFAPWPPGPRCSRVFRTAASTPRVRCWSTPPP